MKISSFLNIWRERGAFSFLCLCESDICVSASFLAALLTVVGYHFSINYSKIFGRSYSPASAHISRTQTDTLRTSKIWGGDSHKSIKGIDFVRCHWPESNI